MSHSDQLARITKAPGFIAALDQSGGSTPKALKLYGIEEDAYANDTEMFALMQEMRARIILAPGFSSDKILGAILFERTMHETINGMPVAEFLWSQKGVVPFLKIDKGLEETANGVQLMKPIAGLDETLKTAKSFGIYGTKERSVVHDANAKGIADIVAQQFELAEAVCGAGLVPILEPEVNIHSETKAEAEDMVRDEILRHLDKISSDVMLKLTIPSKPGLYDACADHQRVQRVVALSGGYSTAEACERLAKNSKMIASFSRALTEGLSAQQSDEAFDAALGANIDKIFAASS
ncbi:fructose bisphosphate aldolase [Primorskyibacter sp. S187A]|uniref:fructose bisphosphate aldolase n=1 Tax=Primorskyibacter sp. S187A TaxID=3415130 RepID=UPI003C7E50B6